MDAYSIILTFITGIGFPILVYVLKTKMSENRELKKEKEAKQSKREAALEQGMVCILRKHLMDEHELWTGKGYITAKALESGLAMYKAYKTLGGNGMIDHMEDEIQQLPIRD